jgi:CIC family chloride channel protein
VNPATSPPDVVSGLPATIRTRLRSVGTAAARNLRSASYLRKWLILGSLLGVIAGLGAVAFYRALSLAGRLILGDLAGYAVPTPAAEGGSLGSPAFPHAWLIPLLVAGGGLVSGVLVNVFAPEAEGHGTDAAIDAVHENPRGVRARAVIVKIIASAITIGSGGSGGREGPTAQISAGFGSLLARVLDLSPSDGRIAVAVGIGSGIGSIFGAPLGGALLSAEILYRDDIEVDALIPGIIASIIGYTVFSAFQGFEPLFGFAGAHYQFTQPIHLAWYAIIGILGGFVGLLYAKSFYGMVGLFGRLPIPRMVRPAVGGLLTGVLALGVPQALGTGYGWIQQGLSRQLLGIPIWIVVALPFAKILATSFSIGSGGSGGIFGPGMVIGAFIGASVWRLLEPVAPGIPHSPVPFVVVGMMACFGAIARAPLAVMIMVAEMTGSLSVVAPAMVAVGVATLIVRRADDTIYRSQLQSRAEAPANRLSASMPLSRTLRVADAMTPPRVILSGHNTVPEVVAKLDREGLPGAPVVDERGAFIGTVLRSRLDDRQGDEIEVGRLVDPTAPTITTDARLDSAVEALVNSRTNWVPVLDERRAVAGILSTSALVRGYRAGLQANLRQVSTVARGTVFVDERIAAGAPLDGRSLAEVGLPPGTIVMFLQRGGEPLLPNPETVFRAGDQVGVLTNTNQESVLRQLLEGAGPATGDGGPAGPRWGPDGGSTGGQPVGGAAPAEAMEGSAGEEAPGRASTAGPPAQVPDAADRSVEQRDLR